jgi:hypothetical protein
MILRSKIFINLLLSTFQSFILSIDTPTAHPHPNRKMKVKLTIFLVGIVVAFALLPLCSEVLFKQIAPTDEAILGFGLLVLMGLLVATFLFGYLLHQIHFVYLHESGVGLILGKWGIHSVN